MKYRSDKFYYTFIYTLLILSGLVCLLPMLYVIAVSLTPYNEYLRQGGIVLIPRQITFEAYNLFLSEAYVMDSFRITAVSTILGTLVNIMVTVMMAYPLAKKDLFGGKFFMLFALVPMLISGGIIPLYLIVRGTGLLNSIWALIVPGAVSSYILIITRTFFSRVDTSIYESARMDGASEFRVLIRIILPISTPILATIGLMYGVGHWNEYLGGVMYMSDPDMKPLQVILREVLNRSLTTERMIEIEVPARTLQMAGVVLSAIPVIVVYPFLQKYFVQGIMLGSVKG